MGKYLIIIVALLFIIFVLVCRHKKVQIEKHVIIILFGVLFFLGWLLYPRDYHVKYEFLHPVHEIEEVEIVRFGHYDEDDAVIKAYVMKENINIEDFVAGLMKVECTSRRPAEGGIVADTLECGIKVIYNNGDYELIDDYGQAYYLKEKGFVNDGYYKFNEAQFELLISYLMTGNRDIHDGFLNKKG